MADKAKRGLLSLFVDYNESSAPEGDAAITTEVDPLVELGLADLGSVDPVSPAPEAPVEPPKPKRTALDWTLEEVFKAGKVEQGPNSALTVLTLLENLAQFPEAQRLAMIRAMDAADNSWDEATVLADANKRVGVLAQYGTFINKDVEARCANIASMFADHKAGLDAQVADADAQIALFQAKREEALKSIAAAEAQAADAAKAVKLRGERSQETAQAETTRYSKLVNFFRQQG